MEGFRQLIGIDHRIIHNNVSVSLFFYLSSSHDLFGVACSVEPDIPFAPNYQSIPGKISKDFFSRVEVPRGHTDGHLTLPWGFSLTLKAISSLKHTWSNKIMADAISAYVRGSTFLPHFPSLPVATVTWYQAWDSEGNGQFSPGSGRCFSVHILTVRRRGGFYAILH